MFVLQTWGGWGEGMNGSCLLRVSIMPVTELEQKINLPFVTISLGFGNIVAFIISSTMKNN